MIVDSHQHFWDPGRGGYDWFDVEGPTLRRPYLPADLIPLMQATGVTKTVLVQADGTLAETDYILDIAAETDFVAGVVGWIDFEDPDSIKDLKRLAKRPKLKGLRPIIQGQPDVNWMFRDDIQWAYRAICDLGLTFDALGKPRHLANFATLAKTYPMMPIVLDHALKPEITDPATFPVWADGMSRLADQPKICCKLSGLFTQAGPGWTPTTLKPYVDHLLAAFGPDRLMWGSNWPVDALVAPYETLFTTIRALTASLDAQDQAKLFGGTAERFYGL
jgi:L-fuconolactonase